MSLSPRAGRLPAFALWITCLAACLSSPVAARGGVLDVGERRLIVAPLNLGIAPVDEVAPGLEPVRYELLAHLRDEGHRVATLETDSAQQLWRNLMVTARSDGEADIREVYARFASEIADQVDYGILVFPSLIARPAQVRGERATWDGVTRWVDVPRLDEEVGNPGSSQLQVRSNGGRGELAAASLHVAVFDASGTLLHEGSGGLTLLQDVVRARSRSKHALERKLRADAFADAGEFREGFDKAFAAQSFPAAQAN